MKILPLIGGLLLMTITLKKKTSINGIEHVKFLEGEILKVYPDEGGRATVGVGHLVTPQDNLKMGDRITPMQSAKLLRQDLSIAERAIKDYVKVPLNQNQYDALVSFIFNVGVSAFAHINDGKGSTLLQKLNAYDYQGALEQFAAWKYVTKDGVKVESDILKRRRKYEQNLFVS